MKIYRTFLVVLSSRAPHHASPSLTQANIRARAPSVNHVVLRCPLPQIRVEPRPSDTLEQDVEIPRVRLADFPRTLLQAMGEETDTMIDFARDNTNPISRVLKVGVCVLSVGVFSGLCSDESVLCLLL